MGGYKNMKVCNQQFLKYISQIRSVSAAEKCFTVHKDWKLLNKLKYNRQSSQLCKKQ